MKRSIITFIVFLAVQCGLSQGTGYWDLPSKSINGLNYFLFEETGEVMVADENCWEGELVLPTVVNWDGHDYPVKYLASRAFANCKSLTRVIIPENIQDILFYVSYLGNRDIIKSPFHGCSQLESIEVAENNRWLCSVDGVLYKHDRTQLFNYPSGASRTHFAIPEGVEAIGTAAFRGSANLTSVSIPNTVTQIFEEAFYDCDNIKQIDIPDNISTIKISTFHGCSKLKSIHLPDNLTEIENAAFFGCLSLKEIVFPEKLQTLGGAVFRGWQLETVVIKGYLYDYSIKNLLQDLNESAKLYVPASEVDRYKSLYSGTVLPLEEYEGRKVNQEYFPEGTKWTEIRLDTLKYDSWYSKVGDEWVPNFETIEYRVQGTVSNVSWDAPFKCVYSRASEWTDSLSLLVQEASIKNVDRFYDKCIIATLPSSFTWGSVYPTVAYTFDWNVGMMITFKDLISANSAGAPQMDFGKIEEIKEGYFGGVRPLSYADVNGVRFIQGIGVTSWNNGECIFGPIKLYEALSAWEAIESEERHYRSKLVHFEREGEVLYDVWPEKPHQPLPLLEGNPIWVFKHEKISRLRDPNLTCWIDDGSRHFAYYFIGDTKEINGKDYTMMGEIVSRGEDITFNRWYPVREENGIVYTITDSLQGIVEHYYCDDYPMPYLQKGNECVLYNFGTKTGETLYPQDESSTVKSFGTYQLLDGTECRVLNTNWGYYDLYEKLGFMSDGHNGIMDPLLSLPMSLDGSAYSSRLNAFYQDDVMLYKAPDAREDLCVNDTIWTHDDANEYARSYKVDPRREEVFAYIQQLQKVTAWEVNIDGLSYLLDPDKHEAIISNGNKCSGELDMPSEVVYEGQTFVTKSMLWNAFYNCTGLTKVRIPKTIETVIHYYPGSILEEPTSVTMLKASDYMNIFRGCLSLEAIEVDVDNPIMCSDNGVLFSKDKTCLYCYPAGISRESFTIPETVTRIGAYAISNNKCLVSLTIPGSVTQICGYTIMYCLSLTDVYYPSEEVPVTSRFAFAGSNIPHATLHVPAGSVDAYKSTAPWDFFGNIVALQNPVTFSAGQMATIVLPTEPDASKGKYYRLAGCKEGEIIFEQELQPRAHVPYIIVPHEDFSIDPAELELSGLTGDTVSVDGVSFIGTYMSAVLPSLGGDGGGFYYDIIDQTPDCSPLPGEGQGVRLLVGALRAYLLVDWKTTGWNDPYAQGGTKDPWQKMPIVLRDNATSIAGCPQMVNGKSSNGKCYNLQGCRISEKATRGIYIEGGKVKARP